MSAHECIGCGQGGAKKPGSPGAYYWFDWLPREKWEPNSRYFVICEDCLDCASKAMFQPKLIARPVADGPVVAELKQKIAILEDGIDAYRELAAAYSKDEKERRWPARRVAVWEREHGDKAPEPKP